MHRMKRKGHIQSILPVTLAALAWMPLAQAANWFALQGVSPPTAPLFGVSGFIEPSLYAQSGTEDGLYHQIPTCL
ncbi:hypothetical protein [Acidithiobacillus caldus]|uniref:hypothetical protein n=1 Tax=Acidithiobacillus caldus TaxID=33059 RepID=UPI001D024A02|nr:hypothetical protein [Acidithiobacillus caldus]